MFEVDENAFPKRETRTQIKIQKIQMRRNDQQTGEMAAHKHISRRITRSFPLTHFTNPITNRLNHNKWINK